MAVGTIYGNTLSDLQAGKNAAQGLDYSRANAEDATSQQRLEAFLRLRGQQAAIQAQQNQLAADRAMRMAELIQQNQQFGTREKNLMDLGKLEAQTRENVAKTTAEGRGVDPRTISNLWQIQDAERQKAERINFLNQLSETRRQVKKQIDAMKANQGLTDFGDPNVSFWNRSVSPEWTRLNQQLKELDAAAARSVDPDTGLAPVVDETTGGYFIPGYHAPAPTAIPGQFKSFTPSDVVPLTITPQVPVAVPPMIGRNAPAMNYFNFQDGQLVPVR